jgi:hypothetical protein
MNHTDPEGRSVELSSSWNQSVPAFRGSGACFSLDRRYRFALWRVWDGRLGLCNFMMLNPSTADESSNDPTVERCERRARQWGYGGLVVTNLFAFCATEPAVLRAAVDPIGRTNDAVIAAVARRAALVVCAWGNHGGHLGRARAVRSLLSGLGVVPFCLGWTKRGEPAHPLYLGYDRLPVVVTS